MTSDDLARSAAASSSTLATLVAAALRSDPKRPALQYHGHWYSAGWLSSQADQLAKALADAGLEANEPVALVPRNRPFGIAAILGLAAQARDLLMIHAFQSPEAMAQAIARSPVRAVAAALEDFTPPVLAAMAARGMAGIGLSDDAIKTIDGLERASGEPLQPRGAEPYFILLTSGTTGPPKHHPLPYRLFEPATLRSSLVLTERRDEPGAEQIPSLVYYPFGNLSGVMNVVMPFASGGSAILLDKFDVSAWRDYVVRYHLASTSLPPVGFRMALEAGIAAEDLSSLTAVITGSSAVDPTVHREFEARYGVPILIGYGATEFAGSAAAMTPALYAEWGDRKFGSAGRAVEGATIRTVDVETKQPNAPGVEGLIEALLPRVSPDWIRTSDIGVVDEDGFLFVRGRADGAIVRGGFKILPETVERALQAHPKVAAAAVVGVPDARLGETPVAAVELRPGADPATPAELEAHLRRHLLAPQMPTEIRVVESLPRTGSLKIARAEVKALFGSGRS